jgi:hypothetical protein
LFLAVTQSSDIRKGAVSPSTVLFVPGTPWSVLPTTPKSAGDSPTGELTFMGRCLFYLGKAEGITVLYDADQDRSLRIPSGQLILEIQSRGQRPECP